MAEAKGYALPGTLHGTAPAQTFAIFAKKKKEARPETGSPGKFPSGSSLQQATHPLL